LLGLWDLPRLELGFLNDLRRVLLPRDVIRWASFFNPT